MTRAEHEESKFRLKETLGQPSPLWPGELRRYQAALERAVELLRQAKGNLRENPIQGHIVAFLKEWDGA